MNIKDELDDICTEFNKEVKNLFISDLVSVIVYGSALSKEFNDKKSDLNMLLCLKNDKPSTISKYASIQKKWQKKKIATPLFLTEDYINQSLDAFPIEFLNIKTHYQLLHGKDILLQLAFHKSDIRLELERELKGKLLHLKLGFLEAHGSCTMLLNLIDSSMHVLMPLFRAMLYLVNVEYAVSKQEIIKRVCDGYDLDCEVMNALFKVSTGEEKLPKKHVEDIFDRYVYNVHKMVTAINNMEGSL